MKAGLAMGAIAAFALTPACSSDDSEPGPGSGGGAGTASGGTAGSGGTGATASGGFGGIGGGAGSGGSAGGQTCVTCSCDCDGAIETSFEQGNSCDQLNGNSCGDGGIFTNCVVKDVIHPCV